MLPRTFRTRASALALAGGLVLAGAACSSSDSSSTGSTTSTTTAPATNGISVSDGWARNSPMQVGNGAAFATITNATATADALVSASVPATIAKAAELHEVVMSGEMMKMQQVQSITVPANGTVQLKSGSYHVMLMELVAPLTVGQTFDLTLEFQKAGRVTTTVTVRDA